MTFIFKPFGRTHSGGMKRSILLAAALCITSAAEARVGPSPRVVEPVPLPAPRATGPSRGFSVPVNPDNCGITVAFMSYGAGIDGPTRARMERLLRTDRRVRTFTSRPWGREGEVTFCINVRRSADTYRLFRDLQNMVPGRPRGPVQVRLRPRQAT
jgi:hypothetical protein